MPIAVGLALVVTAPFAGPAYSAVPDNDEAAGASVLAIGDHVEQVTSEATVTADDISLGDYCGAPGVEASVWFSITPETEGLVILDGEETGYSLGFIVFAGTPSEASVVDCGYFGSTIYAVPGETYTVMAFDFDTGDGVVGGQLIFDVTPPPPLPSVDFSVDPTAKVDRNGAAWVKGSYTCTDADVVYLDGELEQQVGRLTVRGWGFFESEGTCDGAPHAFTLAFRGQNGTFAGGKAASIIWAGACNDYECEGGYSEQTLMLNKGIR